MQINMDFGLLEIVFLTPNTKTTIAPTGWLSFRGESVWPPDVQSQQTQIRSLDIKNAPHQRGSRCRLSDSNDDLPLARRVLYLLR